MINAGFFYAKHGVVNVSGSIHLFLSKRSGSLLTMFLWRFFAIFAALNTANEFSPPYSIRCMHDHGVIHTGAGLLKA